MTRIHHRRGGSMPVKRVTPVYSRGTGFMSFASLPTLMIALALGSPAYAQTSSESTSDGSGASGEVAPAAPAAAATSGDDTVAPAAAADDGEVAAPAAAAPAEAAPATAAPAAAAASPTAPTQQLQNVQVTGSAISSPNAATAVPVTILQADQLKNEGITSTDQLLRRLTSNSSSSSSAAGAGSSITGGAAFADMRGIGTDKTLVLLNGRRIANNAMDGNGGGGAAVDVNMIPFDALERVEILRDGASALYGTDAIGGVINFITKKNLQGGNIETNLSTPTHSGGGQKRNFAGSWGTGDLEKDGFNVMGILSYSKDHAINSDSRSYVRGNHSSQGSFSGSGFNSPTNIVQGENSYSPGAPGCSGAPNQLAQDGDCYYDYSKGLWTSNASERTSLYTVGTFKFDDHTTGELSYFWSRNRVATVSAPAPVGLNVPGSRLEGIEGMDTSKDATARYRTVALGNRETMNTNDSKRIMFDVKGDALGWNYDSAVAYNVNTVKMNFTGGNVRDADIQSAYDNHELDIFDPYPDATGMRALRRSVENGEIQSDKGEVYSWDGKIDRTMGDWFGAGPAAIAIGGELRHERYSTDISSKVDGVVSSGLDSASSTSADRDVQGIYTEVNIPLLDSLEVTGAVRYDHYSQVGDTTNPKVSFRYQPFDRMVVRGSYSEGFRAPSLYEMYDAQSITMSESGLNDPLLCPGGTPANGGTSSRDCDTQFRAQYGGNKDLQPLTSKNWTLGFVFEPVDRLTASVDFWWIKINNEIGSSSVGSVLDVDPNSVVRGRHENECPTADANEICYVPAINRNTGSIDTNGVDISLAYTLPTSFGDWGLDFQGTYTNKYSKQDPATGTQSVVGHYTGDYGSAGGVVFRWKHSATLSWTKAGWMAGLTNNYQSGYDDASPDEHAHVSSYTTWDALAGYQFTKGPQITLGMNNMFDKKPPFTNQGNSGVGGYDPRYFDLFGREVYARLNYKF